MKNVNSFLHALARKKMRRWNACGTIRELWWNRARVTMGTSKDPIKTIQEETNMLFETVAKVIAERADRDVAEITPESRFEELAIDSLDTMDILIEIEGEIGHEIELQEKVETVGDLVRVIEAQVQE